MTLNLQKLIQKVADSAFPIEGYRTNEAKFESLEKGKRVVENILAAIQAKLIAGESVKLVGFGIFKVNLVPERQGRNPKTGHNITIKATKRLRFIAGKTLKDAVNEVEKPNPVNPLPKTQQIKPQSKPTAPNPKKKK